jgi:hypothetical protein
MPIRGSPNGANALVHTIHTPGRHRPESVDAINRNGVDVINRNGWSSSRRAPSDEWDRAEQEADLTANILTDRHRGPWAP